MVDNNENNAPDPREMTNDEGANVYSMKGATFVDVRESDEWAEGHIPGAIHIPLGELDQRANEIPAEGDIVTYCKSGGRSLKAVEILEAAGRTDVKSMAGGITDWKKAGRDVER